MAESDEGAQDQGGPLQNPAPTTKQKKPSGQQFRLVRRARAQEAEAAQARRKEKGATRPRKKFTPAPALRAHLQMLDFLSQSAVDIMNDGEITEEDRRKQLNDTAHAMGKISVQADCEFEAKELEAVVDKERDELREEKQRVLMAEKRLLCPECGAKTTKKEESP